MKFIFSNTGRVWEPRLGVEWTPLINARGIIRQHVPWYVWAILASAVLWLLYSPANAEGVALTNANPGMFDNIALSYQNKAKSWEAGLRQIAQGLFGSLAVISIAWTFIKIALQKDDFKAFIPTVTLQILTLGFFAFLVEQGPTVATWTIASFEKSANIVGNTGSLSPSKIVVNGFECIFRIMEKIADMDAMDSLAVGLPLMFCGILLCFAFVGVAILYLVTLIESYFVMYGGIIMLGFGALPWTREIPKNYLIYAINVGVKLFVMNLVAAIGIEFSSDWPGLVRDSDIDAIMHVTLYLVSGAFVFLAVAWKVPGIAGALSSGGLNFNAGDLMGTTAAAAGAGATVGAVATGGISALASATQGAVQATAGGLSLAREQGASGIGAALKGLGHAGNALAGEAGHAAQAQVGLKPPSPHAFDSRGRAVDNLGTRAANSLREQAQETREQRAAAPAAADQADAVQPGGGSSVQAATGTSDAQGAEPATAVAAPAPGSVASSPDAASSSSSHALQPSQTSASAAATESQGTTRQTSPRATPPGASAASTAGPGPSAHAPAAAPAASAAPTPSAAGPTTPSKAGGATSTPGAHTSPQASAPPPAGGASTYFNPEASGPTDAAFKDASPGTSGSRLKPPPLPPPEQGDGSVSINLNNIDD